MGTQIFGHMTVGEGNNLKTATARPTGSGQGALHNPNGPNGRGLEYFEAGSTLPDQMLGTFVGAASATSCP